MGQDNSFSTLRDAARDGQLDTVQKLLATGVESYRVDQTGMTPLMLAAFHGHYEIAELLLASDAHKSSSDAKNHIEATDHSGETALCYAANKGQEKIAELLIDKGANPQHVTSRGETPLMLAARKGCPTLVRQLVEVAKDQDPPDAKYKKSYINMKDKAGWTALTLAARERHAAVVDLLISFGADNTQPDPSGNTILMFAAKEGRTKLASLLLRELASAKEPSTLGHENRIDFSNKDGWTALLLATDKGHLEIAKQLLKGGASPSRTTKNGRTTLALAAQGGHLALVSLLLKETDSGKTLESADKLGWTALSLAASTGHHRIVRKLIRHGANPKQLCSDGKNILMLAAKSGHDELVKWLLDPQKGPYTETSEIMSSLNTEDSNGWTALTLALAGSHTKVAGMLIDSGASPDQIPPNGSTGIILAASSGDTELMSKMLTEMKDGAPCMSQSGCEHLDSVDANGWSAILTAAKRNFPEIVLLLLDAGAWPWDNDPDGRTLLMLASQYGSTEVIERLSHMLDRSSHSGFPGKAEYVNRIDEEGWTALMYAVKSGHRESVRKLIRAKAHANHANREGKTTLILAVQERVPDVVLEVLWGLTQASDYSYPHERISSKPVNRYDHNGDNAILIASKNGHAEIVSHLLKFGGSTTSTNAEGKTGLMLAAGHSISSAEDGDNRVRIAQMHISRGSDVNASDRNGNTALNLAIANSHSRLALILVNAGADIRSHNRRNVPLLATALQREAFGLAKVLVMAGADIDVRNDRGCTPLISVAKRGEAAKVDVLIKWGANINSTDVDGWTALMHATYKGHIKAVSKLTDARADVSLTDSDGQSALTIALWEGRADIVEAILEARSAQSPDDQSGQILLAACRDKICQVENLHYSSENLTEALKIASCLGNADSTSRLLCTRADKNAFYSDGISILMDVAQKGHVPVLEALLAAGTNLNETDHKGKTALMHAAEHGHPQAVRALIEAGANVNFTTPNGQTALMVALGNKFTTKPVHEIAKVLLEAGASVNMSDINGTTALMKAPTDTIVELLVDWGADIEVLDRHGQSAFQIAVEDGRSTAVDALLSAGASRGRSPLKLPMKGGMGERLLDEIDLEEDDEYGDETVLETAARDGDAEYMRALLDRRVWRPHPCESALCIAAENGHEEVCWVLIHQGETSLSGIGDGPVWKLALQNGHEGLASRLFEEGKGCDVGNDDLIEATERGDLWFTKAIIASGKVDIDCANHDGETPLMIAARGGNCGLVSILLDSGARESIRDKNGWTALMHATDKGNAAVAEMLANWDRDGRAALILSARNGNVKITRILLNEPVGRYLPNHKIMQAKRLALIFAAKYGHPNVIKLLLSADLFLHHVYRGKTPLMHAAQQGHLNAVKLIDLWFYSINERSRTGKTALMYAAKHGHLKVVKLLVENGARRDITDRAGNSAASLASACGHAEVAHLLDLEP